MIIEFVMPSSIQAISRSFQSSASPIPPCVPGFEEDRDRS